ncbi:MAG: inositol monophosphatase, partial [Prolixibacteraceae bacterium]|nr:inositol monophosphatase [Prolixibacteraceae bacterium]
MVDIKKLCFDVQDLVLETAKMIREERENFKPDEQVEEKGQNDFVTSIDKLSEEMLVKGLSERLPESGFVVEEGTSSKKGEIYNWVIDPIDGTTNFIHGLAPHSISIALMRGDALIMGIVYEIVHGEMFYAWEGSAAYLNGDEIRVSNTDSNKHALVVTGFPYTNFSKISNYFDAMLELMEQTSGIRRLGSAAIDLCYVACGR